MSNNLYHYPNNCPHKYQSSQSSNNSQQQRCSQIRHAQMRHSSPQLPDIQAKGSSTPSLVSTSSGYSSVNSGSIKHPVNLRAVELAPLLKEKIALLPGGRTRSGGPILCFPSNSKADEVSLEDLYLLVRYLTYLPEESARKFGFAVVIDMRSGTTWHSVKPILKVLEASVGDNVSMTFIIKPDKIFEKHKAQMAISKFSFEIQLVSLEVLFKEIDPSQLTSDLEGSLPYHHDEWIKIRCALEEFFLASQDMHDKFVQLHTLLDRKINPENVDEAKKFLDDHRSIRIKIFHAPIPTLEAEADRLTNWLRFGISANPSSSNEFHGSHSHGRSSMKQLVSQTGASFISTSWVTMNPDFQQLAPQVRQTVLRLYESRSSLQNKWESSRGRLEQIYQLRLFEEDAGRMAQWLEQQRRVFLEDYVDIGCSAIQAAELHSEHRQFLSNCAGVREQVSRLTGVAGMLADTGHFASQQILKQANQLEHEWKSFTAALEDRSRMLQLSASFHARAESFLTQCQQWEPQMRRITGKTVNELNRALTTLHEYWEEVQNSHSAVCGDGRLLANHLSAPVPTGSNNSLTAAADYSQGRKHCMDIVHELWAWYKQLEKIFIEQRRRVTAKLALFMFKEDVGQVIAWLTDHGEPFLHRQTAVGKSSQRAEQLYNAHMQFEQVAANTLTNAEKLISAADELASQADDPEEILQEASELQRRISGFTHAVESRRESLDLACGFYGHTKEVISWLHSIKESHNPNEHFPTTIEGMEDELRTFHRNRSSLERNVDRVLGEGEALLKRVVDAEEVAHLKAVLNQVSSDRTTVSSLIMERQVRLDLCMQLRFFEADVSMAQEKIKNDIPSDTPGKNQKKTYFWLSNPKSAPEISELEEVSSAILSILPQVEEVLNKGHELLRAFDSVEVNFPSTGPGSSDSGVAESGENAVERVTRLIQELSQSVSSVDELNEKIATELDWRRLQATSRHVLQWIHDCESLLMSKAVIPCNLAEADELQAEHDKFQPVLNEAHPNAVQCAARASYLLQQANAAAQKEDKPVEHSRKADFQQVVETVANRWQKLVYAAEEKHKLLVAASNWYKTSAQVMNVLRQLEKEYRRLEDPCQTAKEKKEPNLLWSMKTIIDKHAEQKEAFLKACILARRTAELFSKYLNRQPPQSRNRSFVEENIRRCMAELMTKEQSVLEVWAAKKRKLEECIYFLKLSNNVDDLIGKNTPELQKDNAASQQLFQETHQLSSIINSLLHQESLIHIIDYKLLKSRLDTILDAFKSQYSNQQAGGVAQLRKPSIDDSNQRRLSDEGNNENENRISTSSNGSGVIGKGVVEATVLTSEQKRLLKRRENLIKELITTEKAYVVALKQCVDFYFKSISSPPPDIKVPPGLLGKEETLFGNIPKLLDFHTNIFEPELSRYALGGDFLPEDVGHCFVCHADRLADLYVDYCVNNTESTNLIIGEAGTFFTQVQSAWKVPEPLQSYLIKPVQRITKYQLILRELKDCCDEKATGELNEGLEVMLTVPKKANDAVHLSMLQGVPEEISHMGDVILQDAFTITEPKQLIKKTRERRCFLTEIYLILAKEIPSQPGEHKGKYMYKTHFLLAEYNITEHVEGDQCKFALWAGRVPSPSEYRLIIKASCISIKHNWVRGMRELMRERMFSVLLEQNSSLKGTDGSLDNDPEAEFKFFINQSYQSQSENQLSVKQNQLVLVLHRDKTPNNLPPVSDREPNSINPENEWCYVRHLSNIAENAILNSQSQMEGWIPTKILGPSQSLLHKKAESTSSSSYSTNPTSHGSNSRRGSSNIRKWLPSSVGSLKEKKNSLTHAPLPKGKLDSSSDMKIPQSVVGQSQSFDNISEESVEVELPPPMMQLPELPKPTEENNKISTDQNNPENILNGDDTQSLMNNMGGLSLGTPVGSPKLSRIFNQQKDRTLGRKASASNGNGFNENSGFPSGIPNFSVNIDCYKYGQNTSTNERSNNSEECIDLTNSFNNRDFSPPSLESYGISTPFSEIFGKLIMFGDLQLSRLCIRQELSTFHSQLPEDLISVPRMASMINSHPTSDLHFHSGYLMLYENALVVAKNSSGDNHCDIEHIFLVPNITIIEDISMKDEKLNNSEDNGQLFWFSILSRPPMVESRMPSGEIRAVPSCCSIIVAPQTAQTRIKWLTELTSPSVSGNMKVVTPRSPTVKEDFNSLLEKLISQRNH